MPTPSHKFAQRLDLAVLLGLAILLGAAATTAHAQSTSNPDSPYPAWASQSGPSAALPFSRVSPNIQITQQDFQGSVVTTPATTEVLPLSLDDAVRRGLEFNLGLRLRQQQQQVASGQRTRALQQLIPAVTATANTTLQEVSLAAEGFRFSTVGKFLPPGLTIPSVISFQNSAVQGNFSWTAFNYSAWKQFSAAKVEQLAAADTTADGQQTVVLNVGNAYLQALADAAQVDNAQSLLQADEALLRDAVAEHAAGTAANLDELRARVQFQTQQQAVIAAENTFAKQKIALNRLIGLDAAQEIRLTDPVPYAELDTQPLAELRTRALATRADYLGAQQQVHAAELQRDAAKAERLPTVTFSGYYGVIGITYANYHGNFAAVANLNFPIFQEAKLRGDREVAQQQVNVSNSQLDNLKNQIDADLRNAYLDFDSAKALVDVARSNVALATKELEQSNDRFQAGVADNLAVVDSQSTLASAQSSLVNSLYRYNLAKLELARALGIIDQQYGEYLHGK
jgi:outer membrane protein TolC